MPSDYDWNEICISGMSGKFPESPDVDKFRENLYNKVDMITGDDRRWDHLNAEVPSRTGKVDDIDKLDNGFFGIGHRQAQLSCPLIRNCLEKTIEAIYDAGVNPLDLQGSKTGVFVGATNSETEMVWFGERLESGVAMTGTIRSMISNRISYFLRLQGPSINIDSACSSSLTALDAAYQAMRLGKIDAALVCGCMVSLHPFTNLQFARLGVLSKDGRCRVFDKDASGYARSEAFVSVFLQKAKDAKRVYAHLIHTKIGSDGYKEEGITFPSSKQQIQLMQDFYRECNVDPSTLSFFEAHGTGTKVGDPEELKSIEEVFCKNRDRPLLIGSVKSNIGHTEPSSGLCSLVKVIFACETGLIPPNINYDKPRDDVKGLVEGRLMVVTDTTAFEDDHGLIAINNFGFGGSNCHVLVRRHQKIKEEGFVGGPRLVSVAARVEEGVQALLTAVNNNPDVEFIGLLHNIYRREDRSLFCRGYTIVSADGELSRNCGVIGQFRELCFVFNGFEDGWRRFGLELLDLEPFNGVFGQVQTIVSSLKVDLRVVFEADHATTFEDLFGCLTVKLVILKILKDLGLNGHKFVGYSMGEILGGYYDNCLSFEEAILIGFTIAKYVHRGGHDLKSCLIKDLRKILANKNRELQGHVLKKRQLISAEFFVQALTTTLDLNYFADQVEDCIFVELGSGQLQDPILTTNQHNCKYLKFEDLSYVGFLEFLGEVHNFGFSVDLGLLYPRVEFPVSRGTPSISPFIRWHHRDTWFVGNFYNVLTGRNLMGLRSYNLSFGKDHYWNFALGHVIDGRNLFPATGYLKIVWDTLAYATNINIEKSCVIFENCRFIRAVNCVTEGSIELQVRITKGGGHFDVLHSDQIVVTGHVNIKKMPEPQVHVGLKGLDNKDSLPLTTKDIYKELRLRGYNYSGLFRGILELNKKATKAKIKWTNNWVSFLDNLLQMRIVQYDSRLLYVPTCIKKMTINAKEHLAIAEIHNSQFDAYFCPESQTLRCGGIQVSGIVASSIVRRKQMCDPVLEKYLFVPNQTTLTIEESVRVNIQIMLENKPEYKVKIVEVLEDTTSLVELLATALGDQPVVQTEAKILTSKQLEIPNITVENKPLRHETDCSLIITSNLNHIETAFKALKEKGFILIRQPLDAQPIITEHTILTIHHTEQEKLTLIRQTTDLKRFNSIDLTEEDFQWLPDLQQNLNQDLVLHALNSPQNGILGLVNCVRREPGGGNVRCIWSTEEVPPFDQYHPFYNEQLRKNMAINVFKDGVWGTYRHLTLGDNEEVEVEHRTLRVVTRGDLSSCKWFEGHLNQRNTEEDERTLIHVYYAGVNFRDVMMASGKINIDMITQNRLEQSNVLGFECAGRTLSGKRVFTLASFGVFSTLIRVNPETLIEIPDYLTMEEAVTIPVVYHTVLYAFCHRIKIKEGDTILIHSGTGGVGQAAIRIALYYGCEVFTTVGTPEKRQFIKELFPTIDDNHIGNSRDLSFENLIKRETKGRGVDIVLNSLAEEKLDASVRCLADGGKFLEIGKFDIVNDRAISLISMERNQSFHGIMLDELFKLGLFVELKGLFEDLLQKKVVKPLSRTVFPGEEMEKAFRYMTTGKHVGKVVVELRKEEQYLNIKPTVRLHKALPQYFCHPLGCYVVCGGLGGFGLELADWLVLRGAQNLVLTSRVGVKTGYQDMRVKIWRSYGVQVCVSTADITTEEGCRELLEEAQKLGEVRAIFNLAVVLHDAILENQTVENFRGSYGAKALATEYLDLWSRRLCPQLTDFVCFSSVSCGRGNPGQTNYGLSNSVMERICERRRSEGLPGLAIQWGAIGEVGLVADMQEENVEIEIGGTLQQRVSSCLEVLDRFLRCGEAVVSSIVVAEKKSGSGGADNIMDAVANILGIKDLKSISYHATLAELGMDSMTAVEIKQTLEREFEVFLTAQDMRSLTFSKLLEIQEKMSGGDVEDKPKKAVEVDYFSFLFSIMGKEELVNIPIVDLNSRLLKTEEVPNVICYPGIEGIAELLNSLSLNLRGRCKCVQYCPKGHGVTMQELAQNSIKNILPYLDDEKRTFTLIAHSFGVIVALEAAKELEDLGYSGSVFCIDGSPEVTQKLSTLITLGPKKEWETNLMLHVISQGTTKELAVKMKDTLEACGSFEERVESLEKLVGIANQYSIEHLKQLAEASYKRIIAMKTYKPSYKSLKSKVLLFKPTKVTTPCDKHDFGLSEVTGQEVPVEIIEGDHISILSNPEIANLINQQITLPPKRKPKLINFTTTDNTMQRVI